MLLRSLVLAAVAAVALSSSPARAGTLDGEWYGSQVIATDAISWAVLLGGIKAEVWPVAALGASGLFLGGPVVHVAHGNYGRAGISFGTRVAVPFLGAVIGAAVHEEEDDRVFIPASVIIGAVLGSIAASAVDIAILAREDDPRTAPRILSFGGQF
jgi:hypothetical protein